MSKTLVFGASLKPNRYSNYAIQRLVDDNHEVLAFGLNQGNVQGISIDVSLEAYHNIHTVTLYLNPNHQQEYYDYIIGLKPKRVIFNPGTENPEFFQLLRKCNVNFEIACTLVLLSTNQY